MKRKVFFFLFTISLLSIYLITSNAYSESPLTVKIVSPSNDSIISGTDVPIEITFNSKSGAVTNIALYVDGRFYNGKYLERPNIVGNVTFYLNTVTFSDGKHTIMVRAYDTAGNEGKETINVFVNNKGIIVPRTEPVEVPSKKVQIDTTPPNVKIFSPANNSTVSGTVEISSVAKDNIDVSHVLFYINKEFAGLTNILPYKYIWDTNFYKNDKYELSARAVDTSDNSAFSPSVYVKVYNKPKEKAVAATKPVTYDKSKPEDTKLPSPKVKEVTPERVEEKKVEIKRESPLPEEKTKAIRKEEAMEKPKAKVKAEERVAAKPQEEIIVPVESPRLPLDTKGLPSDVELERIRVEKEIAAVPVLPSVKSKPEDTKLPSPKVKEVTPERVEEKKVEIKRESPLPEEKTKAIRKEEAMEKPKAKVKAEERVAAKPQEEIKIEPEKTEEFDAQKEIETIIVDEGKYVVKLGDILESISKKFNVPISLIAQANNVTDVNDIKVGQRLNIPGRKARSYAKAQNCIEYTARRRDSLTDIANRFGVTIQDLVNYNNITDRTWLIVGQRVLIPPRLVIHINGEPINFSIPPIIKKGRTIAPAREFLSSIGASFEWNSEEKELIANRGESTVQLKIGEREALVNGKSVDFEIASYIYKGLTMAPLRATQESLGADVVWDNQERNIYITCNK